MKESKKKRTKKTSSKPIRDRQNTFDDLGIEPPKIYREAQRPAFERQNNHPDRRNQKKSRLDKNNLTHAQRRAKNDKKRKKRNKLRKILLWIMAVFAFAATAVVLSLTVFFKIEAIDVAGNTIYQSEEILAQCPIDKGQNLFLSDTKTAKQMLEQNLPYIYNAEIKRKLPCSVSIEITEAAPAYSIMKEDETYILLDNRFKVLEDNAQTHQGIMIQNTEMENVILGQPIAFTNPEAGDCLNKLAKTVNDNNFGGITAIYSNNINDNYVVYEGRIEFKLGNCDDLEKKIYQALTACEELNKTNPGAEGIITVSSDKSLYFTEKTTVK